MNIEVSNPHYIQPKIIVSEYETLANLVEFNKLEQLGR